MTNDTVTGRKLRLGFLGLNDVARLRMEYVLNADAAEVVAVSDDNSDSVAEAMSMAPGAENCPLWEKMLGMNLDGMVISNPTIWLTEQIIATLKAGVPVFSQRPLGRNLEEATRLIEASHSSNRLLTVDFCYRYMDGIQRIRELVLSGDLGRLYGIEMKCHMALSPDEPWRHDLRAAGGGCVMDSGVHLIDALLWMTGSSVSEVTSHTLVHGKPCSRGDREVEDYAAISVALESGAVGYITSGWNLHVGSYAQFEMSFYGTHGAAKLRNLEGSMLDFEAIHCVAAQNRVISTAPDDWTGKCLLDWIDKICQGPFYHPDIEAYANVASVIETIYSQTHTASSLNVVVEEEEEVQESST